MLQLQVSIPTRKADFDFSDARPMPFLSAPSTPKPFGHYPYSAPTSPGRVAEFYRFLDEFSRIDDAGDSRSMVAFQWEEKPGTSKSTKSGNFDTADYAIDQDDFAFDFSVELEKSSLFAEELFDGGKIRPLKPPPQFEFQDSETPKSPLLSPRSPRSPITQGKKIIREVFSPRKKKESDPFATALDNARKGIETKRGRDIVPSQNLSVERRGTRSLSPFRVVSPWEEEEKHTQETTKQPTLDSTTSTSSNSSSSTKGSSSRRWRLKDFLLFRSASEGRASDKDYLKKYTSFFKKHEDVKNASFRSTDGSSSSKRKGRVSAHELHYTMNRAASEGLKKKTFLPYKAGLFGFGSH